MLPLSQQSRPYLWHLKLGKNLGNVISKIVINYDLYTIIFIKSYSTFFTDFVLEFKVSDEEEIL